MRTKKFLAATLCAVMVMSLAACGGSDSSEGSSSGSSSSGSSGNSGNGVAITIFNSKSEIQDQFEEMAKEYAAQTGVDVEVYYSNDTVAAHLATKYASNDPYTIAMVDAKDIYSLADEHAVDMSDQDWVQYTDYAITVNDRVVGFPFCVEARGIIYNATPIEAITGETFDPSKYETLDEFKDLLATLEAGGMNGVTGIMKEDWSLGAHYLAQVYEERSDVQGFIDKLLDGTEDLMSDAKFNELMDTFDALMEYNYAANSPIAAEREVSEQKLAEGDIAFMFGGNWDWSLIAEYDYTDGLGMMPVPQDTDDGSNHKLVGGGSKYIFIDSSDKTSDEQRQAALDFLNWLVLDPDGNAFLTEQCSVVPAYSNIESGALDPLSQSVKKYADAGELIDNYNYLPDDHYAILGANMQEYLAGRIDRAALAEDIENYWKTAEIIDH